jgi:hypothetical protein
MRLHQQTHETAHAQFDKLPADKLAESQRALAAAQQRFDASQLALQRAQRWQDLPGLVLRWGGVVLTAIGVVMHMAAADEKRGGR